MWVATVVAQRETGRLEVVSALVAGDRLAQLCALDVGRAEVDARPDARVDDLAQHVGQPGEMRVVPDSLLRALNATRSVPKKCCSVVTIAPVAQRWPDGWSGNGGVTSGGAPGATGVDGSKREARPDQPWWPGCRRCPPRGWR